MNDIKKFILKNKFYLAIGISLFFFFNYLFYFFRVVFLGSFFEGISFLLNNPNYLFLAFPLSFNSTDIFIPLLIVSIVILLLNEKKSNKKVYKKGSEHGSAEWGNVKTDLMGMRDDENFSNNLLLSENARLMLRDSQLGFMYRRNKNVVLIGGSGTGKTRSYVKPNLLQMNSDYVVTDSKGTIISEVGMVLKNKGNYKIKVFNTIDFSQSMKYNPLAYVKNSSDILKLVNILISNTEGKKGGDVTKDFWVRAEELLYSAYISLIITKFPKEEQNLLTLMDLISYSEVPNEDEEENGNVLDYLFEELERTDGRCFAVRQYASYKKSQGKTTSSILISCGARLAPLNVDEIRELIEYDELDYTKLGTATKNERKTALFLIVPDNDNTFNFLVAILYSQMFNTLTTIADNKYRGFFPTPIQFILDEFANIGLIPNFENLIGTIRSRNMSATVILQTLSQLDTLYKGSADTIIGNCDTFVFLGGKERSSLKFVNELLGKQTINDSNASRSYQNASVQETKIARDLMTKDEISKMPKNKCIVSINGLAPFYDNKYEISTHPNYKYHAKSDGTYWFDYAEYVRLLRKKNAS